MVGSRNSFQQWLKPGPKFASPSGYTATMPAAAACSSKWVIDANSSPLLSQPCSSMTIAVGLWTLSDSGLRSLYVRVTPPTVKLPCSIEPAIAAAVGGADAGGADVGYDPHPQSAGPTRAATPE